MDQKSTTKAFFGQTKMFIKTFASKDGFCQLCDQLIYTNDPVYLNSHNNLMFCSDNCVFALLDAERINKTVLKKDFDNNVSKSKLLRTNVKELRFQIKQKNKLIANLKKANEEMQIANQQLQSVIESLEVTLEQYRKLGIRSMEVKESPDVRNIDLD